MVNQRTSYKVANTATILTDKRLTSRRMTHITTNTSLTNRNTNECSTRDIPLPTVRVHFTNYWTYNLII